MNLEEAKFTLQCFRPGTEDEQDPIFREALALLKSEPLLNEWYQDNVAFDLAVRKKFSEVEPPSELAISILAGMRATAANAPELEAEEAAEENVATKRRSFWLRPEVIGIAAVFLVVFAWVDPMSSHIGQPVQLAKAAPHVPNVLAHLTDHYAAFPGFERTSNKLEDLKVYFEDNNIPSPQIIPSALAEKTPVGCLSVDFNGSSLGMICFRKGLDTMHLYTIPESAYSFDGLEAGDSMIIEDRGRGYKVWRGDKEVYVLATEGETERLKEIF